MIININFLGYNNDLRLDVLYKYKLKMYYTMSMYKNIDIYIYY
jgi:hypothetical protein